MALPRILLVPNIAGWIIAEMANQIQKRFAAEFEFYFLPESLFWRRPELCADVLQHVNLVHCLNESSVPLIRQVAGDTHPPILTWIHHVTRWSEYHEAAAQESVALVACTPGWKAAIEEFSQHRLPVEVVRHGVDSQHFAPEAQARTRLGLPKDAFLIGFFGSKGSDLDGQRKGIPVLIETLKAALPRIADSHALFVGPGWEPLVAELKAMGLSASSRGYVRHADLPGLYSSLDAFLMTSTVEGGPCTVLESMACGTPVVATRVGLVPDVVVDRVNGFSANVGDSAALAASLLELASDPQAAKRIRTAARATVVEHSWYNNLTPLGDLYRRSIRPSGSTGPLPQYMHDPARFWRTAVAADVLARTWDGWRVGGQPLAKSMRDLREMLAPIPWLDRARGAAAIKRLALR